MNYQLTHIFDKSACLSRRQMRNYINERMTAEERHAAEHHLNNCPLCAEASEGYIAISANNTALTEGLSASFLNDHFGKLQPQVHQNSFAPAMPAPAKNNKKTTRPAWVNIAVASVVIAGLAVLVYREKHKSYLMQQLNQPNLQVAAMPVNNGAEIVTVPDAGASYAAAPVARHAVYTTPAPLTGKNSVKLPPAKPVTRNLIISKAAVFPSVTAKSRVATAAPVAAAKPVMAVAGPVPATASLKKEAPPAKLAETAPAPAPVHDEAPAARQPGADIKQGHKQSSLQQGDELYSQHNYQAALDKYEQDIDAPDYTVRHSAAIKAAKCYSNIGDNDEAKKLLKSVISDGGPEKHNAKKLLRRLKNAQ